MGASAQAQRERRRLTRSRPLPGLQGEAVTGDLYPTKTRLQLLDDVDVGFVCGFEDDVFNTRGTRSVKVTAQMRELERAGWVERPEGSAYYRLTDAGRVIRDGRSLS